VAFAPPLLCDARRHAHAPRAARFTTDHNVSAVFNCRPAFFVINGAAQTHDSALTTASAEMRWMNYWSAAAPLKPSFRLS